jgi:hypothetical protein
VLFRSEEVGITRAELITDNDLGFQETDDAKQLGYDKNYIPQQSVVQAVINYMELCDKMEDNISSYGDLAQHRPEGSKSELNPVQVQTYSFFYSKTQVFKMDRVYGIQYIL